MLEQPHDHAERLAKMWAIASDAGYDHAIGALRTAAQIPGFRRERPSFLQAAKLLEDLMAARRNDDLLINETTARNAFFDVAVGQEPNGHA